MSLTDVDSSMPNGGFGQNVVIFEVDMSSSIHFDNKKKDVLILGESPTQGLDGATLTAEKTYSINFTKSKNNFFKACIIMEQIAFYPYSILANKCSGSCNNINDPYAKLCVPDVVKNMKIKVFNLT